MQLLNLGILAHVDAGKTTTVEQLLFKYGGLRSLGSVDKGNTQTDFLSVERERGISVASASVTLDLGDIKINIIDTPGHMDFTGEVERALSVLDGVVLIVSAAEGIQSQTERFWKALREMCIPTVVFINKIDRSGCNPDEVLQSLQAKFSSKIFHIDKLTDDIVLEICENDESLTEMFLAGELHNQQVQESLINQAKKGLVFPLLYGAAANGLGIDKLMDTIKLYLPAKPPMSNGEAAGLVYKVEHDKAIGKIAHVRLYEGCLRNRDTVTVFRPGIEPFETKISQIRRVSGSKKEDIGVFQGNEIAAVCGMAGVRAGDMIGRQLERLNSSIAIPLFSVQLLGPVGKESQLLKAISELSDEDPLMNYDWNKEERELVIRIMGKIQLEVLEFLLLERYDLAVSFSAPSVIYKETPAQQGIGLERYTMPKPCWAVVKLQVDPLPYGSGLQYESIVSNNSLLYRYQTHVETAVPDALKQGRLGWEVTDLKVTLIDGEHHHVHTHPLDFFLATPIAVMKALEDAGSTLLEPLVKLNLTADESLSSRLIGDILKMRGEFDSPVMKNGLVEIEAIVPVAASMDYPVQFSSLTSGKGIIKSDFYGYKECPLEFGAVGKRRGVDPLDRDKWILYKRGALG